MNRDDDELKPVKPVKRLQTKVYRKGGEKKQPGAFIDDIERDIERRSNINLGNIDPESFSFRSM